MKEIESRIIELAFSANFMREMREMRMFAHATEFSIPTFISWGRLERRLHKMRFHMIDVSEVASWQRTETKLLAHTQFLELLQDQGPRVRCQLADSAHRRCWPTANGRCEKVVHLSQWRLLR